ncbi:MAG: threonine/serine dehydratase [Gemmatimonadales bacterium]|nr:threonine/serine dehydratase [Candidatus Palauibacter irciniicola]MYC18868.1 threonine/serine dehydratase [Gemmatimonadales bacterium]
MTRATATLVSLADVEAAHERIRGAVRRTPLIPAPFPRAGGRGATDAPDGVWLKCENLQRVSAFKARGAYNYVSRLSPEERAAGLLTYSSGNHAQAVAWAARAFGVPARIVMPVDAPDVKREATIALGAQVELEGTTSAERKARAEQIQREVGGTMVPPFDDPDIIAGQGTVALEIIEQLGSREPGMVLAPIGGGGQLSGVAAAVRRRCPEAEVIGVEPEGAASMLRSLEHGAPVTLDRVSTVADGLKPVRPGDLTFAHCRDLVDRVITVDDEAIRDAVRWLFGLRLIVEPSGAATVAALLSGAAAPAARGETVAVLSGGNIEPALLADWIGG